jgi:Na+/proline symporter
MQPIDYAIVALYLLGIVALGIVLQRRAARGINAYFLGNRSLPWWALGSSGMASNTDIAGTMLIAALVYALGTKGFFIELRGGIVLIMAFFMVFMGKWTRRAQVMTLAEWMRLRFGAGRQGNLARIVSALANLAVSIGIISYFAVGGGKFFAEFLGIEQRAASLAAIGLAMIYTAASGFYGVIWTDVFQGVLIFAAIIYVCAVAFQTASLPETFSVSVPLGGGEFETVRTSLAEWSSLVPPLALDLPGQYASYNLLGVTLFFYTVKTVMQGMGGSGGYMLQRYFAARSDREAGLLSLFWILLLAFRWPLVTAFAVLGIHYSATQEAIADPELILPTVISEYIPVGVTGLLVACFVAAAMSTFDSVINASAAYWVRDIYQGYLNPNASQRQLVLQGRLASVGVVALGVGFSFAAGTIEQIWGFLTYGLGAGLIVPLLLRWYWWRFNGYGFALGTLAGMAAAIAVRASGIDMPEYAVFLLPSGASLLGCLVGTWASEPTPFEVLDRFYRVTRPFGAWGPIRNQLERGTQAQIRAENRRDLVALLVAVPWQLVLFLMGMMLVMRQWEQLGGLALAFVLLSIGLYWVWFRLLSREVKA